MVEHHNMLLDLSVLNRNINKYYDAVLEQFGIGSGQLMVLLYINEHEGVTLQEAAKHCEVDKGTASKAIKTLLEEEYVAVSLDENDRRLKHLYLTESGNRIMKSIYEYRNACRKLLSKGCDFDVFEKNLEKIVANSKELSCEVLNTGLRIGGMQKMTLLDYPGLVASTIFTGGCNFKCPFCHNKDLVFLPDDYEFFQAEGVLAYLHKRKGILDGVCISGGEPLVQSGLLEFIRRIKEMGYRVKLDTNGYSPARLKEILDTGYIDYVAMDIKNCKEKYASTIGLNEDVFKIERIQESIDLLMQGDVDYEFRTTVIREMHDVDDFKKIGDWISGCKRYFLQQYMDSGNVINPIYSAYDAHEMHALLDIVKESIPNVELRGIKEG